MAGDLLTVVEAAYSVHGTMDHWLARLLAAASSFLNRGMGVYAFCFDAREAERVVVSNLVVHENAFICPELVRRWHGALGRDDVTRIYRGPGQLATLSERLDGGPALRTHPAMRRLCHTLGIHDQLTLRATDPTARGVAICAPLGQNVRVHSTQRRLWTLMAAHVAAGYRLRLGLERLADTAGIADGADAVFDPDGRCVHTSDSATGRLAIDRLQRAVVAIDRARTRVSRASPEDAVAVWKGLVAGTWSMVEHFESDGRRYVLARRNAPGTPDPKALSERERKIVQFILLGQSTKETAYALGLTSGTVAGHLASAMRKLGVKSRVELLTLLRGAADAGHRPTK